MSLEKEALQIMVIVIALFAKGIKGYIENKKNYNPLKIEERLKMEKSIQEIIDNIVKKTGLSSVSILAYHNGVKDLKGIGFTNTSMRFESVNKGVKKIIPQFQSIPVSTMVDMLIELNRSNEKYVVIDADHSQAGMTQKYFGIEKSYNFLIGDDISSGVLCCCFNDINKELSEHDILYIKSQIVGLKVTIKNLKLWKFLGL